MKQLSSAEIRQMFLDYFKEKGHQVERSAPLVPVDDPTLLWINSGVATLKPYFDGTVIPDNPQIVNVQKSIRTNDIENVGLTARHHTFFEMLGNFSIGDYFKKEAIIFAWEFLTSDQWIGFDESLLSVTVHPEDDEAYDIWLNDIKLPAYRIIRLEENFWDIGVGPSGPNTEIFYDRGEKYGTDENDPELYPGGENDRYLEIWNLVFSQFNHNPDDTYTPLPNKNIDTGMGLERLVSIMQDTPTNFETDLFMPIIKQVEKLANTTYGASAETDTAFKVIVDHIRTVSFAIGDGALPSNEGRGYVLRRLIRRAVRFAKQIGIDKPFMYKLVAIVGEIMEDYYPEVTAQKAFIENVIKVEEDRFHETLNEGLDILSHLIEQEKANKSTMIAGVDVFKLYDTYGFPKELTEEYVAEHGLTIDDAGFEAEMQKQRERARSARQQVGSMHVQDEILAKLDVASTFIGYDHSQVVTTVEAIIKEGQLVERAETHDDVLIILSETPFYAESGGQVADQGIMTSDQSEGKVSQVTKAPRGQHLQHVHVTTGSFTVGEEIVAHIDTDKRNQIVKNHTATHLLHQALRDVLGNHVTQAGSLVSDERLRFDLKHFGSITAAELEQIEEQVNEQIWASLPVKIEEVAMDTAQEMGAMALFGEKYGDVVRVVQIGDYSIELCGGCHVKNTAEIGLFKIIAESGIGSGTRRIEAATSSNAFDYLHDKINLLHEAADLLKTTDEHVPSRIEALTSEVTQLTRANQALSSNLAKIESASMVDQVEEVEGINLLAVEVSATDMRELRNMLDEMKQTVESGVILLAAAHEGKVLLAANISQDLISRGLHAGHLIKQAAELCGGGGGGRPDAAQAGGNDPSKIKEALASAKNYLTENIKGD